MVPQEATSSRASDLRLIDDEARFSIRSYGRIFFA